MDLSGTIDRHINTFGFIDMSSLESQRFELNRVRSGYDGILFTDLRIGCLIYPDWFLLLPLFLGFESELSARGCDVVALFAAQGH